MSISDLIDYGVGLRSLVWVPHTLGLPQTRRMVASSEVNELVVGPWHSKEWQHRCIELMGDLDRFTGGAELQVALPGVKRFERKPRANLRLLDPGSEEVWEIRGLHSDSAQSVRILGSFAATDMFVALVWRYRKELGEPDSKKWRNARLECRTKWRNLFSAYPPFTGAQINDYISSHAILC